MTKKEIIIRLILVMMAAATLGDVSALVAYDRGWKAGFQSAVCITTVAGGPGFETWKCEEWRKQNRNAAAK